MPWGEEIFRRESCGFGRGNLEGAGVSRPQPNPRTPQSPQDCAILRRQGARRRKSGLLEDCLVRDAVLSESVSRADSLKGRESTGKSLVFGVIS